MEKFDAKIIEAKDEYQPRADFVDTTMQKIRPRRRWGVGLWSALAASGLAVAALAFIVLPHLGATVTNSSQSNGTPASSRQTSTAPIATGDAALTQDLNGIGNAMSTANTDQKSADNAINDSQQQIAIPTE